VTDLTLFANDGSLVGHLYSAAQARTLEGLVRDAKKATDARLREAIVEVQQQTGTAFTARSDGWSAVLTDPQPKAQVLDPDAFADWCVALEDDAVEFVMTTHVTVTDHKAAAQALKAGDVEALPGLLMVEERLSVPEDTIDTLIASGRVRLGATEAFDTETGEVVPGVSVKTASPTLQVRGDKNAKGAMRAALVVALGLPAELAGGDA